MLTGHISCIQYAIQACCLRLFSFNLTMFKNQTKTKNLRKKSRANPTFRIKMKTYISMKIFRLSGLNPQSQYLFSNLIFHLISVRRFEERLSVLRRVEVGYISNISDPVKHLFHFFSFDGNFGTKSY